MKISEVISLVVAVLGSGGILGGVYALLKLRPEAGQIVVTAAQSALIVQSGVIETLRQENERLRTRVDVLEAQINKLSDEMHARWKTNDEV